MPSVKRLAAKAASGGRGKRVAHENSALAIHHGGQKSVDSQHQNAVMGDSGHCRSVHRGTRAAIAEIREQWRQRQSWHRAEKSLTLQAKAMCRRLVGGDKTDADKLYAAVIDKGMHPQSFNAASAIAPLLIARDHIEASRKLIEKRLIKLVAELPVAPWIETVRGLGSLSVAGIIGEAGDLSLYINPGKLWKRMGLAVFDGQRQRRVTGVEALEQGYSPSRRSLMWTIGDCMIRAQKESDPYKILYAARRVYTATTHPDWTKGHSHNDAKRYIEKRLLRELWRAWRAANGAVNSDGVLPSAVSFSVAATG